MSVETYNLNFMCVDCAVTAITSYLLWTYLPNYAATSEMARAITVFLAGLLSSSIVGVLRTAPIIGAVL